MNYPTRIRTNVQTVEKRNRMPLQDDLEKMGYTGYPYMSADFDRDKTVSIMRLGYAAMSSVNGISKAMLKYCGHIYDSNTLSTEQLARLYRQAEGVIAHAEKIKKWACDQLEVLAEAHHEQEQAREIEEMNQRAYGKQSIEVPFKKIVNRGYLSLEEFKQVPSDGFILYDRCHYHVHVTERSIREDGYLIVTKAGCTTPTTFKYKEGIKLPRHKANGNL